MQRTHVDTHQNLKEIPQQMKFKKLRKHPVQEMLENVR